MPHAAEPYLLTLLIAALIAVGVSPATRWHTSHRRLRHDRTREFRPGVERPRVGGLIIFSAFALAPFVAAALSDRVAFVVDPKWRAIAGLYGAAFLVFLLGYLDDLRELSVMPKACGLIAAGLVLYSLGYRLGEVSLPGGGTFHLGWLDLPATLLWVFLITNAVNFIDGHDGVATGVAALAACALAYIAADLDHALVGLLFAALAGATLGFLPFNFPRASKFLGDSGALLLGFLLAALSISGFVDETGRVPLYIPVIALGVPILDTALAFTRRLLNGRNPLSADEDHMHHRLARRLGMRPRPLALTFYAYAVLFAVTALVVYNLRDTAWTPLAVVVTAVSVLAFLLRLGYHETVWHSRSIRLIRRAPVEPDREHAPTGRHR